MFTKTTGKINVFKIKVIRLNKYDKKTFIESFFTVNKVYLYRRRYKILKTNDKILKMVNLLTGNLAV